MHLKQRGKKLKHILFVLVMDLCKSLAIDTKVCVEIHFTCHIHLKSPQNFLFLNMITICSFLFWNDLL